jgi:hypothetical protein
VTLDRIMDWLTSRRMKLAGTGHAPDDPQPETGSGELSEELEADYGPDTAEAEPPPADGGAHTE